MGMKGNGDVGLNPGGGAQGGDVSGTTGTSLFGAQGKAIQVAKASFDPGYDIDASLQEVTEADLREGFCGYGKAVGERS